MWQGDERWRHHDERGDGGQVKSMEVLIDDSAPSVQLCSFRSSVEF
jgi:hypothetical protein